MTLTFRRRWLVLSLVLFVQVCLVIYYLFGSSSPTMRNPSMSPLDSGVLSKPFNWKPNENPSNLAHETKWTWVFRTQATGNRMVNTDKGQNYVDIHRQTTSNASTLKTSPAGQNLTTIRVDGSVVGANEKPKTELHPEGLDTLKNVTLAIEGNIELPKTMEVVIDKTGERPFNEIEAYFQFAKLNAPTALRLSKSNDSHFTYIINPEDKICEKQEVFLMAFVPTAVEHYDYRRAIRKTWGEKSIYPFVVRFVFVLGLSNSPNSAQVQKILESEASVYGDIVQANFIDAYRNLTYKSIAGIRWVTRYCSQATYVLKIDDDTFVNMDALLQLLNRYKNRQVLFQSPSFAPNPVYNISQSFVSELAFFGRVVYNDDVHRTGKWAVPDTEFRFSFFPTYCSGPGYALTMPLAIAIAKESAHVPFFYLEDIYVTGFVPLLMGSEVQYVQLSQSFVFGDNFPSAFLGPDRNNYLFAIQIDDNRQFVEVWTMMQKLRSVEANKQAQPKNHTAFSNSLANVFKIQNHTLRSI